MKISPVSPMRTKLLKTFVLSVAFGMVSCGLEDNLSEIAPEGDTGDATGGKSTGGAASTKKTGTGGSSKSSNATGGKASASAGGSDADSGVGGAKATGKSSTTRGSASTGGAKATGSGGASNADDTDGESGSNASPKGGSNGQRSSTTRTSKAGAGGTGTVTVPMGGAKSNSAGGAGNTSSNGGTTATSSGGSGNTGNGGASTGGSKAATGGAATGGAATGGAATGGVATGGVATGGVATGGVATGGVATGGVATGGVATGGKPATGGAATGGAPTTTSAPPITGSCSEGQKALTANGTGTHCGYTYEYWKDQGTGTLTLKADGFSVDWSNINNLLGRKGVRPGTGNEVVTYDANYQPNGNSYLCIYGWFKNPLVEYYIVDSWGTWRPPGGQGLQGTVTCDGATYDIYKLPRTGPSIEGDNTSFTQYFNVRQQKRTSGTINVGCHIASWKAKGMSVGSFYEVSMTVEGYQSSGKADVKFSMK